MCMSCRWRVGRGLETDSGRVRWCYVCVSCESGFFVGYLRILGALNVQSCSTLSISRLVCV